MGKSNRENRIFAVRQLRDPVRGEEIHVQQLLTWPSLDRLEQQVRESAEFISKRVRPIELEGHYGPMRGQLGSAVSWDVCVRDAYAIKAFTTGERILVLDSSRTGTSTTWTVDAQMARLGVVNDTELQWQPVLTDAGLTRS